MKSLLLLCIALITTASFGQHFVIGAISDENNEILPFANVVVKHSEKGVYTNVEGIFIIEAKPTDTLQVSYLGYTTQDFVVRTQDDIKIVLKPSLEQLNEVVIKDWERRTTRCGTICCYKIIGIDDTKSTTKEIKLYPNPSKDGIFNMQTSDRFLEANILVADLTGRIIFNKPYKAFGSNFKVDLSNQSSGVYIINVSVNGTIITSKKAIKI